MANSTAQDQKVLVVDFGAQYGQLIARRVRDLGVYSEIVSCDASADEMKTANPSAILLSGGPASVYADDAPSVDPKVFELGVPVLGFCYGQQIMAVTLGGKVGHTDKGEYGHTDITRTGASRLLDGTPDEQTVWMSHRDAVSEVPEGFVVTSTTANCPVASMEDAERKFFATQFHPEVRHTQYGKRMLENNIKPEYECFELGHIDTILGMAKKSEVPAHPMQFNFVLGVHGCTPATVENLAFFASKIPAGSTWTVSGVGRAAWTMAAAAIAMGGNVRVGFEDNIYLGKGQKAASNGELVAKVVRIAKELGREIATPAEAREILSLKPLQ